MLRPAFAKYHAKELDVFDFAAFHEISRTEKNFRSTEKNLHSQSWDLNPGLLGEKLIHSLCAMPPPSCKIEKCLALDRTTGMAKTNRYKKIWSMGTRFYKRLVDLNTKLYD